MKKIIALRGIGSKGKTATLNLVIDLLQVATTGCSMPTPQPTGRNRKMTFTYNGLIVSVCTAGDTEWELSQNEIYFNDNACDVAITASRTKQGPVQVVLEMEKKNAAELIWAGKTVGRIHHDRLNEIDAKRIIELI